MIVWLLLFIVLFGISTPFLNGLAILFKMNFYKTKSIPKSIYKTFRTVCIIAYLMVYQKMKNNVVMIGKGEYDILYVLHEQLYKIRVYTKRGPRNKIVLQVINENDEDVTSVVSKYLGPMEDFHGIVYKPETLGYKQLTFNLQDGTSELYDSSEPIKIKQ